MLFGFSISVGVGRSLDQVDQRYQIEQAHGLIKQHHHEPSRTIFFESGLLPGPRDQPLREAQLGDPDQALRELRMVRTLRDVGAQNGLALRRVDPTRPSAGRPGRDRPGSDGLAC